MIRRVVIAGGGVASLEAVLALRAMAGDRVHPTIVAPDPIFRHRPLSVTEPFALSIPRGLMLARFAADHGADFVQDALTEVDTEAGFALTRDGLKLHYDDLIVATGAQAGVGIPGALPFWDSADRGAFKVVLAQAEAGSVRRLVFAVPDGLGWALGLYELALLTAVHLKERGVETCELMVVTHEARPMSVFGSEGSQAVHDLLRDAGVKLRLETLPKSFASGELEVSGGEPVTCDHVVSLPLPAGPRIDGLPQDDQGFLAVDRYGEVLGLSNVFAAGDITTFPVKQGGLATQAADSVASVIAERAGADVTAQPFAPVLRGAILTQWGPRYLRNRMPGGPSTAARSVLWWPPAKIAGRYLAPYLAKRAGYSGRATELVDLDAPPGEHATHPAPGHVDLVSEALRSARASAAAGGYERALHWLEVAEDLSLYLPPEYETQRERWAKEVEHSGRSRRGTGNGAKKGTRG